MVSLEKEGAAACKAQSCLSRWAAEIFSREEDPDLRRTDAGTEHVLTVSISYIRPLPTRKIALVFL